MPRGTITRLQRDRRFGFITPAGGGQDVFFHASQVRSPLAFTQLREGVEVEYDAEPSDRGPRATSVRAAAVPAAGLQEEAMATDYRFLNPYNFVRFLTPATAKARVGDAPTALATALGQAGLTASVSQNLTPEMQLLGRCAPPPHDRYVGITGQITCRATTVTPLFISDSEGIQSGQDDHKTYRFFQVDGRYAIPATALRGTVRSVFEAATNSCMAVFEGARLSYHYPPQRALGLIPARVERSGSDWMIRLLTGTPDAGQESRLQYAAWVRRYEPISPTSTYNHNSNTTYRSRPCVNLGTFKHGDECWAVMSTIPFRRNHPQRWFRFWNVEALEPITTEKAKVEKKYPGKRVEQGWLCITNQNIENKHDERLFFRSADNGNGPLTLSLASEVREAYEDVIKDYQKRHREAVDKRRQRGGSPDQRDGDEPAFSRFILEDSHNLRPGDLVYALVEGTGKNQRIEFIVPVSIPRLSYDYSIATLLATSFPDLQPCDVWNNNALTLAQMQLCPACRVFGWVHQQAPENQNVRVAYAGRVRFSHGIVQGTPKVIDRSIPLAILSSPKPTTTAFYVLDADGQPSADVDYNNDASRLRGRKFYRHHGQVNLQRTYANGKHEYERIDGKQDGQNRTVTEVLDKDNAFIFTMDFQNLAPVELGALLWALEMDGCYHRLGFAKPLGFGSVRVEVTQVDVLDPRTRYASLKHSGWQQNITRATWQEQCITPFKIAMASRYNAAAFDALENIKDLKALLGTEPTLPVHYPRPTSAPAPEGKNFEWFMGNKRRQRRTLTLAEQDSTGLPLIDKDGNIYPR